LDLAAVFLLSLLGGYLFSSIWTLTAHNTRRIDGHHLYFKTALYGIGLFLIALVVRFALLRWVQSYRALEDQLVKYVQPALKAEATDSPIEKLRRAQWVVVSGYSLLLGPLLAVLLNLITSQPWALERSLGQFDKFLREALKQGMPISLTLTTGKVYIGLVLSYTDPESTPVMMTILPMYSGFRDAQSRVQLTTDYEHVYDGLRDGQAEKLGLSDNWLEQFALAIRVDMIVTVTQFSPVVHAQFNPNWRKQFKPPDEQQVRQELVVEIKRRARDLPQQPPAPSA
jgi:hypothetical protein